jgi:hypothetical protein
MYMCNMCIVLYHFKHSAHFQIAWPNKRDVSEVGHEGV